MLLLALLGLVGTALASGELTTGPATVEVVLGSTGIHPTATSVVSGGGTRSPDDQVARTDISTTSITTPGRTPGTSSGDATIRPGTPSAVSAGSVAQSVQLSIVAGPFITSVAPGADLLVLEPSSTAEAVASLPELTVVNALGDGAPWASTGVVGDFHAPSGRSCPDADCISGTQLGWAPTATTASGPGTVVTPGLATTPGSSPLGAGGATLCSAPAGLGGGTFACAAGLTLAVPTGTPVGDYTAVLSLTTLDGAVGGTSTVVLTTRVGTTALPVVPQGGAVPFSGGGFGPGTPVTITLHSTPVVLTTTTADAEGNFAVVVTIPTETPPGMHRLVATGVDGSGRPHAVSRSLSVVSAGMPPGTSTPTPPTTPPAEWPEVLGAQGQSGSTRPRSVPVAETGPVPNGSSSTTTTRPPTGGAPGDQAIGPGQLDTDVGGSGSGPARWWLLLPTVAACLVGGGVARRSRARR